MNSDYAGQHYWIIGASAGIGHALAIELARRGCTLTLSARDAKALHALNKTLGEKHLVLPLDVANPKNTAAAVKTITKNNQPLDGVVFMAGIYDPLPIGQITPDYAARVFAVNILGAFNLTHALLPHLENRGKGQIALCASVAGWRGLPRGQPYSATKAALINFAESLRLEYPALDIRVINPGFVRTRLTDKNRFAMPMMIEPDAAARAIADGLKARRFDIHFPRRFTWLMRLLRILPDGLYFRIARRLGRGGVPGDCI